MSLHSENVKLLVEKLAEGVRTIGPKASVLMNGVPTRDEAEEIADEVLKHSERMEKALSRAHLVVTLCANVEKQGEKWGVRLFMRVERGRSVSVSANGTASP